MENHPKRKDKSWEPKGPDPPKATVKPTQEIAGVPYFCGTMKTHWFPFYRAGYFLGKTRGMKTGGKRGPGTRFQGSHGGQKNLTLEVTPEEGPVFFIEKIGATLRENPGLKVKLLVGPTNVKSH